MSRMTRAAAVALAAALALAGCGGGGDDAGGDDDPAAPTAEGDDAGAGGGTGSAENPGGQPPAVPPDVSLEPVSDEWTPACETSTEMVDLAWQLADGGNADPDGIAALMVGLLDQVPPGAADDEVAYARDLIAAFGGGDDLAPYQPEFRGNVEALLRAVGAGCGIDAEEPLPLPGGMVDNLEAFLFGA